MNDSLCNCSSESFIVSMVRRVMKFHLFEWYNTASGH